MHAFKSVHVVLDVYIRLLLHLFQREIHFTSAHTAEVTHAFMHSYKNTEQDTIPNRDVIPGFMTIHKRGVVFYLYRSFGFKNETQTVSIMSAHAILLINLSNQTGFNVHHGMFLIKIIPSSRENQL